MNDSHVNLFLSRAIYQIMDIYVIILIIVIVLVLALLFEQLYNQSCAPIIARITGSATSKTDEMLDTEYRRWSRTHKQYELVTRGMNKREAYEARAILERWLISSWGLKKSDPRASHFIDKMRDEFAAKRLFSPDLARQVINDMLKVKSDPPPRNAMPIITTDTISFGDFSQTFSPERIKLLRSFDVSPEYITTVALRYAHLLPGGQQWSIPARVYDILVRDYGVTLEGFASPFNSQLMRYARERDVAFCSLFPDLDRPFGAIGTFEQVDLVGKTSAINPPYIIHILDLVADKCIESCVCADAKSKPTRMFIVVPNWTDAKFYSKLSTTKYLDRALRHGPRETFYENPNARNGTIVATFATTIFILSSGGAPNTNYDALETTLRA